VQAAQLERFVASAYRAVGISAEESRSIAELMVRADVNGADGHGVFRLP
jgi:L-2-hydroxycarboxylate dehydrogenase (NAD+)